MNELFREYGYLGVFLLSVIDHTGTPLGLLMGVGLVTTGSLALVPTLIIATAGGITADVLLYTIGFFGGHKAIKWFQSRNSKVAAGIDKAERFLNKYGIAFLIWGKLIFIVGRYIGLVYGSIKYKFSFFLVFSAIGAVLITVLYGIPAYLLGRRANELFQNKFFTLYLTSGLIVLQIIGSSIWFNLKKRR